MGTPRINCSFESTTDVMIKASELRANTDMYIDFLVKFTGKEREEVFADGRRDKYVSGSFYQCLTHVSVRYRLKFSVAFSFMLVPDSV